jgi:hypothetical protein
MYREKNNGLVGQPFIMFMVCVGTNLRVKALPNLTLSVLEILMTY